MLFVLFESHLHHVVGEEGVSFVTVLLGNQLNNTSEAIIIKQPGNVIISLQSSLPCSVMLCLNTVHLDNRPATSLLEVPCHALLRSVDDS